MTTLLMVHNAFYDHVTPEGHPEGVDRLRAISKALEDDPFNGLQREDAPMGTREQVELAHPKAFVDAIEAAAPSSGYIHIDGDTVMSPGSLEAAYRAVGAACHAVDQVMAGDVANAFCAGRPPGHHAEKTTAMGFCLFSTAAIAALHARQAHGLKRVAVVDFDVHHGNGTQDVFWDDPDLFYASSHEMPLFPGTGHPSERGANNQGNIVNVALSRGDGTVPFQRAYTKVIFPALRDFAPELIVISAGFDAHSRDPIGGVALEADDFDWVTAGLMAIADEFCSGRIVSVLEGGYDLQGLATSTAAHIRRLMTH
ncbi:MAG: histone deacetylase family protein [Pseudomonadota bacterium]